MLFVRSLQTFIGISAAMCLGACATPKWAKSGATENEFYADKAHCMSMAGAGGGGGQIMSSNDPATQGYNQVAAMYAAQNRDDIFNSCMKGKGWRLSR